MRYSVACSAWMAQHRFPGIVTAYAITDDFVTAVINARQDSEKLPERLTLKGRSAEAALALSTIRHIERTVLQNRLLPPTLNELTACHDKVQRLYSAAYDWPAPPLPPAERTSHADAAAVHQGLDHPMGPAPSGRRRCAARRRQDRQQLYRGCNTRGTARAR